MVVRRAVNTQQELFESLLTGRKRIAKKGDILFQHGDVVAIVHVVCRGRVKLMRCSLDGNPITLQTAAAGDMLAEASLFATHYHCMAQVESESVELRCFERNSLMAAISASPDASMVLLQLFAHQIRRQRGLLEIRNIRAAKSRIHAWLLLQADADQRVLLSVSLKDTAHQLGLAHETFYRELKKLEGENKLARKDGFIQLY